jgi:hypothetical protein
MSYCDLPFKQIVMKEFSNNNCVSYLPCNHMLKTEVKDACTVRKKDKNVLNYLNLDDAFNSYEHIRQDMLKGLRSKDCEVCWKLEDAGEKSYRQDIENFIKDSQKYIIDINCGNACNLACRMCTPGLSSKLHRDLQKFKDNKQLDQINYATDNFFNDDIVLDPTNSQEWQWIYDNSDKIGGLKFAGGEPFVNKKVLLLLRFLIYKNLAKNINLSFYTNCLSFDLEKIKILESFNGVYANVSVEAVDELYEYIRYPGNFNDFIKNLNLLKSCSNLKELKFNVVVSILNVLDVDFLFTSLKGYDIGVVGVFPMKRGINISNLPDHILDFVKNNTKNMKLINLIDEIDNIPNREKILLELNLFDSIRNQNYKEYLNNYLIDWLDEK